MKAFIAWFKQNWKSNLIATAAIVYSAQAFVSAIEAWEKGESANWRTAIVSLLVAAVGYVSKDASTHSTAQEVQAATIEKTQLGKP